jgi:hypothetical protein
MTRLHNKSQWHRGAHRQLQKEPLCAMCLSEGKVVAACISDHIEPHHNDPVKFWTGRLYTPIVHESRKKFVEHRGFDCTIGADGWPTDPNHPVYRAEKLLGSAEKQPAPGKRDAPLGPSVPSE